MKFMLPIVALFALSAQAFAADLNVAQLVAARTQTQTMAGAAAGLKFHVGDSTSYQLDVGGFLKGTLDMKVREETNEGFWIVQDVDVMIQKQHAETLIDKNDGHIIKMIVDGKEQTPPSNDDTEVVKVEQSQVTVPQRAAPYDAVHVILKNKKDNSTQEAWVNPKEIPVTGMLKMVNQGQMPLTAELTAFARAN